MAKLATMSVDALLKMRKEIGEILARRADELKRQLSALTVDSKKREVRGRGRKGRKRKSLKGRKVAPKYRGPNGETWAGRGARPRWLQEAMKSGAKPEDFLIAKGAAASRKRTAVKRSRRRKAA